MQRLIGQWHLVARREAPAQRSAAAADEFQPSPMRASLGNARGPRWLERVGMASGRHREEKCMITYIGLPSFTEKGIQGIKDSTREA
jgi:hypothetical protein